MAYVSQAMKAELAPTIKAICKKYGMKATLAVRHHSTLCLNIKSGKLDIIGNYNETMDARGNYDKRDHRPTTRLDVNVYWVADHYTGKVRDFLQEVIVAMKGPKFFDNSDPQTDYFNCSHYFDINVGKWDKPYVLEA